MKKPKKQKTKYWKAGRNTVHKEGYADNKTAYREITGRALVLKLLRPVVLKLVRDNKLREISMEQQREIVRQKYRSEEELTRDFHDGYMGINTYYMNRKLLRGEPEIPTKEKVAERILLEFYAIIYQELVELDGEQDKADNKKSGMRKRENERRASADEVMEAAAREAERMEEERKAAGTPPEDFDPYEE